MRGSLIAERKCVSWEKDLHGLDIRSCIISQFKKKERVGIESGILSQNAPARRSCVGDFKAETALAKEPATPFNSLITFVN